MTISTRTLDTRFFTSADGLSHSEVRAAFQDSRGFLWFGSRDGLNKYDGYEFTVYKHDVRNTNSLSDNVINLLYEDRAGIIWIGVSYGGINAFNRETETFRRYRLHTSQTTVSGKHELSAIYEDRYGILWAGDKLGRMYRFDRQADKFVNSFTPEQTPNAGVKFTAFFEDAQQRLWFADHFRLRRYDRQSKEWRVIKHYGVSDSIKSGKRMQCVLPNAFGKFWIADEIGLRTFDPDSETLQPYILLASDVANAPKWSVLSLLEDGNGAVWVTTGAPGLLKFDPQSDACIHYRLPLNKGSEKQISMVWALCTDNGNALWCGTRYGMARIGLQPQAFWTFDYRANNGLSHPIVRSLCVDSDGDVWVGADNGLNLLVSEYPPKFIKRVDLAPHSEPQAPVNAIMEDKTGALWFGSSSRELVEYNRTTGHIKRHKHDPADSHSIAGGVYSMYEDREGTLWFGTSKGLQRYNRDTETFSHPLRSLDSLRYGAFYVFDMLEDRYGILWAATYEGLFTINRECYTFDQQFIHSETDTTSLSNNAVWALCEDRNGTLWAGVYGGGLNRFNRSAKTFTRFTESDGLANNVIYGILPDADGHLWISTNSGLSEFTPANNAFRNFDVRDGLQGNEFYFGAYCQDARSGLLYFGGINGFSRFHPEDTRVHSDPPPLSITGFRIFDRLTKRELFGGDTITLQYDQNFVSFEFAALDFENPGKHMYAYKLDGIDRDWVDCGARRYAAYTNLESGVYRFYVKGSNSDGVWNESGMSVALVIEPPWWQTAEAYAGFGLTLMVISVSAVGLRKRHLRKKAAIKRKILESELRSLRLQINPHFLFNSLCSIQHFIIRQDQYTAYDHLSRFARLMRIVLEHSYCELISLTREIEMLRLYLELESLRFEGVFQYTIDIVQPLECDRQMIPPALLQPYVENAIIHGLMPKQSNGLLQIKVCEQDGVLKCIIEDNGIGREAARRRNAQNANKSASLGMSVASRRMQMLSENLRQRMSVTVQDLYGHNGVATGTRVIVQLPLTRAEEVADSANNILRPVQ